MDQTTTEAAPQPVATQVAQTSGDNKTNGASNLTASQYALRFVKPEAGGQTAETKPAEQTATEKSGANTPAAEKAKAADSAETPSSVAAKDKTEVSKKEADEALSKSTSQVEFTPEQQALFDEQFSKRVAKEVAKRKFLEEELASVKAKLTEVPPAAEAKAQPAPTTVLPQGAPPLANITDIKGLVELQQQAKEAIRYAEDVLANESDGEPIPEGWTRKTLRDVIRNAKLTIEDHIPARSEFLRTQHQAQQTAYELCPFLKDKESELYVHAQNFRRNNPWLASIPASDLVVGLYIKGVEATKAEREAAERSNQRPVIEKKANARPSGAQSDVSDGSTTSRSTPGTQARQAMQAASEKLKAKGSVSAKDYASFLANKELLKTR